MTTKADFLRLLQQVAADKDLPREYVREAMQDALAQAYRQLRHLVGPARIELDEQTGEVRASVLDAAGERVIETVALETADLGRIGAFAARSYFEQRLRQAEARYLHEHYARRVGQLVRGTVRPQDPDRRVTVIALDRGEAILPAREHVPGERYLPGQSLVVLLKEAVLTERGLQLVVSRADPGFVQALLGAEVPEIAAGEIEVKAIAREPGVRTKVAVAARVGGMNPVAVCIGARGARIRQVCQALGTAESVDVLLWQEDLDRFVADALGLSVPVAVTPEGPGRLCVRVPARSLSLAIGRQGANVRLASKLVGQDLDLVSDEAA